MRIELGFGIGFDRDNRRINAGVAAKATKQILVEASRIFGGCNLLHGQGAWIDPQGNLILEESCTLVINAASRLLPTEFDSDLDAALEALAEFIRRELNQKAVYVTKLVATSKLVTV